MPGFRGLLTGRYLRDYLQSLPEDEIDLPVLIDGGFDHSYDPVTGTSVKDVEYHRDESLFQEYWGDEHMSGGRKVQAIVVSRE